MAHNCEVLPGHLASCSYMSHATETILRVVPRRHCNHLALSANARECCRATSSATCPVHGPVSEGVFCAGWISLHMASSNQQYDIISATNMLVRVAQLEISWLSQMKSSVAMPWRMPCSPTLSIQRCLINFDRRRIALALPIVARVRVQRQPQLAALRHREAALLLHVGPRREVRRDLHGRQPDRVSVRIASRCQELVS